MLFRVRFRDDEVFPWQTFQHGGKLRFHRPGGKGNECGIPFEDGETVDDLGVGIVRNERTAVKGCYSRFGKGRRNVFHILKQPGIGILLLLFPHGDPLP